VVDASNNMIAVSYRPRSCT